MKVKRTNHVWRLTVDPSIGSCGWCLWDERPASAGPLSAGVITPNKRSHGQGLTAEEWAERWWLRAESVAAQLAFEMARPYLKLVACEFPQFYDNEGGRAVAVRGDLQKLSAFAGLVHGLAMVRGIPFRPVLVSDWKGQMPKDVVNRRILRVLGEEKTALLSTTGGKDDWDACGIGLALEGLL